MKEQKPIEFYDVDDQYGFLSNVYPVGFTINDIHYKSNEHFYQSKKFEGQDYEQEILDADSPGLAYDMGQTRKYPLRQKWRAVKEEFMYKGLKYKFTQNPDLKQKLLATGNRIIVEVADDDGCWGNGGVQGQNRLGALLMKVRDELRCD